MIKTQIAIIGGGPAGLRAALAAAGAGAEVLLIDDSDHLGGQLIKQTHMFFGSQQQYAGTRGVDIAAKLAAEVTACEKVTVMQNATALGLYADGVLLVDQNDTVYKVQPERLIVATGAAERLLAFPNNDLPGVYGAGAVQTLMNVHGVKPGDRVLMVGSGNIGLIVSYQLMQAGVEVAAIVEAAPTIGGYLVHAAKVRRAGVPILTRHTIKEALGEDQVCGAIICQLDENWQQVPGTEQELAVDVICLAVGLSPLSDLLWQAGCKMVYVPELGGHVAWRDQNLCTSDPRIYLAGDVAGVEEASSAMVEGQIAGLAAALSLDLGGEAAQRGLAEAREQLNALRSGPVGEKIRAGLRLAEEGVRVDA
ncbi:MAG: NAD(P)/FAD-dependent oxidoreductase [Bacillota bacterium]|jgi:sarcosine oxidase subunit alpha